MSKKRVQDEGTVGSGTTTVSVNDKEERRIAKQLSRLIFYNHTLNTVEEVMEHLMTPVVDGSIRGMTKGMSPKKRKLFHAMVSGLVDPFTDAVLLLPPYMLMGYPGTVEGAKRVADKIRRNESIKEMTEFTKAYRYYIVEFLRDVGRQLILEEKKAKKEQKRSGGNDYGEE